MRYANYRSVDLNVAFFTLCKSFHRPGKFILRNYDNQRLALLLTTIKSVCYTFMTQEGTKMETGIYVAT